MLFINIVNMYRAEVTRQQHYLAGWSQPQLMALWRGLEETGMARKEKEEKGLTGSKEIFSSNTNFLIVDRIRDSINKNPGRLLQ